MFYDLPDLSFSYDALEPLLDAETVYVHHQQIHRAYVQKLNAVLFEYPELQERSLRGLQTGLGSMPPSLHYAVRESAGGVFNHGLFWRLLQPGGPDGPVGPLAHALEQRFGSVQQFREQFTKVATSRIGSGWAWLVLRGGELFLQSTPNEDNPLMALNHPLGEPIIGLDLWEHAYWLSYRHRRPAYCVAFLERMNWQRAALNYEAAMAQAEYDCPPLLRTAGERPGDEAAAAERPPDAEEGDTPEL